VKGNKKLISAIKNLQLISKTKAHKALCNVHIEFPIKYQT